MCLRIEWQRWLDTPKPSSGMKDLKPRTYSARLFYTLWSSKMPLHLSCRIDSFRVLRQSFCGKFQIVCGVWTPATPAFRMYGYINQMLTLVMIICWLTMFPKKVYQIDIFLSKKLLPKGSWAE